MIKLALIFICMVILTIGLYSKTISRKKPMYIASSIIGMLIVLIQFIQTGPSFLLNDLLPLVGTFAVLAIGYVILSVIEKKYDERHGERLNEESKR